jgi:hypothetical protein
MGEQIYQCDVQMPNGNVIRTTAKKVDGSWFVGGDFSKATTDLGGKIFIYIDGKIYLLKGCVLKFQDYEKEVVKI